MIIKLKQLILSPRIFFNNITQETDINKAYLFGLIFGSAGIIFECLYGIFWPTKFFLDSFGAQYKTLLIILMIFSPLIITITILLYTGVYHLFLWIAGARGSIKKTFQVICYVSGIYVLNIIPFLGNIVSGIWGMVLLVIGTKRNQEISYLQAVGALLATIILFIIIGRIYRLY